MASTKYDLFIYGESSHAGATPQDGSNSILAAATLIQQLYQGKNFGLAGNEK